MAQPPASADNAIFINGPGRYADLGYALGQVRRLYCAGSAKEPLVDALDALIGRARHYFADTSGNDNFLAYVRLLREYVERFDRFGLLSELDFLDRWLQNLTAGGSQPVPYKGRQRRLAPLTVA